VNRARPQSPGRGTLPAIAIGGGLAGAAFALELARNGRRVIVLERTHGAHHKVCGEFLSEEAQAVLGSFGLDGHALGATPINRFRLVTGEHHITTPLPFAAMGVSRFRLDEALLRAAERAGAEVIRGATVTGIDPGHGEVTVRVEGRTWRATAVALATGKHSLRGLPRPAGPMVGFKLHFEPNAAARELAGVVQLVFFRDGYVGACLVEEGVLSVGWVMRDHLVRSVGSDWSAQSAHLARQSSFIGDLVTAARPLFAKPVATAAIPYGFLRTKPIAPEVFPIGDQLAVVPSFTGDGMAIALHTGLAAARAVLAGRSAAAYQREVIGWLRPQFRFAGGVGRFLEMPMTCATVVATARVLPSLITGVAKATRLSRFRDIVAPPAGRD
jgi:menaquinone-9 beta-reductase